MRSSVKWILSIGMALGMMLGTVICFGNAAQAEMAQSKSRMATPTVISISQLDAHLKKVAIKRKLSESESDILNLALLGRDIFGYEYLSSYCTRSISTNSPEKSILATPEAGLHSISLESVGCPLHFSVQKSPKWDQKLSAKQIAQLKSERPLLDRAFASDPYVQAWISYQLGDKAKAKTLLADRFNTRRTDVMKLESTSSFGHEDKPLAEEELLVEALDLMSTADEKKDHASKLREMKTHMSVIPNHQIMT